jgi:regulatory protein
MSAYTDALKMLGRRELTEKELRDRLIDRDHPRDEIDRVIAHLLESKTLDDARVARAYARTAASIKGRGRLRVLRELNEMGVARPTASEAVAEVFADVDERAMIAKALKKKLGAKQRISDAAEHARLYQFLMRQGFTPAAIVAALGRVGGRSGQDDF